MSEPSADKPPRGGLTPAGWTAISAIVVALIGATVTLTTNWWQHAPPVQTQTAAPSAAPAEKSDPGRTLALSLADPSQWTGAWVGSFQDGGQRRRIELRITAGCAKGKACGTIRVPHVPCTGDITLADVTPDGAEFSVDRFEPGSAAACSPGAGEVFRETPEGALAYTATYSGAQGVLTRTD